MTEVVLLLTLAGTSVLLYTTMLFGVAVLIKRNDIADAAWGPGIALVALIGFTAGHMAYSTMIPMVLITLWAARLAYRILTRFFRHSDEDPRYAAWRREWGRTFYVRSYLQVFILQGVLMIVLGYPMLQSAVFPPALSYLTAIGTLLWCIGFYFEARADHELARFLAKSDRPRILTEGLWKYSRHPNYFGEVLMWWGIWVTLAGMHFSIVALVSPITITLLILFVSGVPMLEARYKGDSEYEAYARRTSVFIPMPPRE